MTLLTRLAACSLSALLLAAPAAAQTAPLKTLKVAPHADLKTLDPVAASIVITRMHGLMIYETLFAWDANLQPKPQMVDTFSTAPDNLSWTFKLRPGLKFHDGQPVTTKDVLASLKRWMARDTIGGKLAQYTAGIEAIDDQSFTLKLKRPLALAPFALGSAVGQIPVIMRESDASSDPMKPVTETIGSGSFKFNRTEWRSGAKVVYDKNTDYVPRQEPADGLAGGRVVKVDRVEWIIMPDPATAAAALQTGEIDIWEQPSQDLVPVTSKSKDVIVGVTVLAGLALITPAQSQDWPQKRPITLVSPYPPGGTNDIVARMFADKLSNSIGQSIVVENRAGSAGAVGTKFVAAAAPDGYTLLSANNGALIIQPLVNQHATYDALKDFTPITELAGSYLAIGAHKSLGASTVQEFIAALKANPGKYFYGSSGAGSFGHFNGEFFKSTHGLDVTHVPFRGSANALTDLIRGEVHFMMDPLVLSQEGDPSVRIFAVTNPARIPSYPNIPTIAEAGYPEFNLEGWFGVLGPAGLPQAITDKIAAVAVEFVKDAEVQRKFEAAGIVAAAKSGKDFADLIASGRKIFSDIQKSAKIVINQ